MDGNARWAARHGQTPLSGHQAGLEAFKVAVRACDDLGIAALTVYAFSTENWQRSQAEVSFLMTLFTRAIEAEGEALHARGVKFRGIGEMDRLPTRLRSEIQR